MGTGARRTSTCPDPRVSYVGVVLNAKIRKYERLRDRGDRARPPTHARAGRDGYARRDGSRVEERCDPPVEVRCIE
eukprot:COSAG02_NODE_38278_length_431_cov_0.551205_1_plen_75_part_10